MKQFKFYLTAALTAVLTCTGFISCDNDDKESTVNPAEAKVFSEKKHDTAILLCTFGSTYNESLSVYDKIYNDFKAKFGGEADIYLSFTSRTCILRAEASTGEARYKLGDWLEAIGKAGYKRVAVQSLHVIPGEEYLSLMNTDVKKNFMIEDFPTIDVLKGANLLSEDEDTEKVAEVIYKHYKDAGILKDKKNLLLLMGHGNPDENYSANKKYSDVENALHAIESTDNNNIFVGTVDYGDMLFWPREEEENEADRIPVTTVEKMIADYPTCTYSKIMKYCHDNNLQPSEVNVYLAPFMSIAGDHAHNDLWGLEALAEHDNADYYQNTVKLNSNEYSWRERLTKIGFKVNKDFESHPIGQAGADHGIKSGCGIKALGDYPEIRQIWVDHLYKNWKNADAWENGKGYQLES
ncbi:heme-binding protein [Bacteroides heparinolyticus]|uniref:Heme-binding protein n=2 Tax=Prevotella heparinolytica TaxID=28113 RepID=A0A3P2A7E4_9BACE|nr:sirohydrochlorin cobaltochelatase [Bacteroides heparinolyticus]RRD90848.1 heme-binding protein [Bacteroides heparinolyticus]